VTTLFAENVATAHNEAQDGARSPPSPCKCSELRPSATKVDRENKDHQESKAASKTGFGACHTANAACNCSVFCSQSRRGTTSSKNPAQDAERHEGERTQTPGSQGAKHTRTSELSQTKR